jgi:hypothetical protein
MKRLGLLIILLGCLYFCNQPKQEKVTMTAENGVEVIINYLEPYKIKGEQNILNLRREFAIDTEREDLARIGLTDIFSFDVDSDGSIYFMNSTARQNFIFEFDINGNFLRSFGRRGQGPGELQSCNYPRIYGDDKLAVSDAMSKKLLLFEKDGSLFKEISLGSSRSNVLDAVPGEWKIPSL